MNLNGNTGLGEKVMINLPPSNFKFTEQEFKDIIRHIRETDQTGRTSNFLVSRKTYILMDDSKFYITEVLKNGKIDYYYYDWVDKVGKDIMKFHSEPHDDPKYRTDTEPYHIHGEKGLNVFPKRYTNYNFRDLFHVLEVIRMIFIHNKVLK